ncbi:hypothetical protein SAMN04488136_11649 [Vibrio xiamenensis]|uniref:Uncharacterized protein n=1 Tax=Vibrio xiamenensis TaxID=861298 RepID=A0A1G8CG01_9VIBR|nr:hypothetical protein SAMN04488136_11649 [Vibrio xiamenensis]
MICNVKVSIQDQIHEFSCAIRLRQGEVVPLMVNGVIYSALVIESSTVCDSDLPSLDYMYLNALRQSYMQYAFEA